MTAKPFEKKKMSNVRKIELVHRNSHEE